MSNHPLFEIVTTTAGAVSIRNKVVNEIMHNPVGPWVEANTLYIDQSRLRERLTDGTQSEFVIFDVGLGAAANSLAALACIFSLGEKSRPVRIVSFERDLDLLRFALEHASHFHHFTGFESILEELLEKQCWTNGKITWELRHGDFLDLITIEPHHAHLIFYDPYSPKMNEDMWTTGCFQLLREKSCDADEGGAALYTYTRATRVRVAMIAAGFFVGFGAATGLKNETTEASTDLRLLRSPVEKVWFDRWRRSHLRHPFDCKPEQIAVFDQIVEDYILKVSSRLNNQA